MMNAAHKQVATFGWLGSTREELRLGLQALVNFRHNYGKKIQYVPFY